MPVIWTSCISRFEFFFDARAFEALRQRSIKLFPFGSFTSCVLACLCLSIEFSLHFYSSVAKDFIRHIFSLNLSRFGCFRLFFYYWSWCIRDADDKKNCIFHFNNNGNEKKKPNTTRKSKRWKTNEPVSTAICVSHVHHTCDLFVKTENLSFINRQERVHCTLHIAHALSLRCHAHCCKWFKSLMFTKSLP